MTTNRTPGPWDLRPVPGMKCIAIAKADSLHPHAYVTTTTDAPEPLTDVEYANAAFIVRACNAHAALVAALERIAFEDQRDGRFKDIARAALAKVQA